MIGLNILAQFVKDRDKLYHWLTRVRPTVVVVMDNIDMARRIRSQFPGCTVIYRAYNPNDHRWHEAMTPAAWLDMHTPQAADGIVLQVFNEPGFSAPLAAWCVEVMRLAAERGIRLCLPNFAVGNPPEDVITSGAVDDLLRAFARYPQHILGLHEYWTNHPVTDPPYLTGRFRAWLERAEQIGAAAPRIVITEHGRDRAGARHDGWRGIGLSEDAYADMLIRAQQDIYALHRIPTCVFCYGASDDWQSFDMEGAETLLRRIEGYNTTMTQETEFEALGEPRRGILTVTRANYVNVRQQSITTAPVVTTLRVGARVSYRPKMLEGGGYQSAGQTFNTWYRLEEPAGWIAAHVVTLEEDEVDIPVKRLDVPFVSQMGAGANNRINDCGIACALMLYRWRLAQVGMRAPKPLTVDRMLLDSPLAAKDAPLTLTAVERLLDDYGVDVLTRRPLTTDAIVDVLENGQPVIALVNYAQIGSRAMGHYIVVFAYGERGFWIHDPYERGAEVYLKRETLDEALRNTDDFAAFPYQGIVLTS